MKKLIFNERVVELLQDPATVKVLATVGGDGVPHAVVKQSLQLGEDGNLYYLEQLESSRSNSNMVRSIWFDKTVSVLLVGQGARAVQIKGRPIKAHITGALFQEQYNRLRAERPDADLAAVWVIEPESVIDENPAIRRSEEARKHPHFVHLDRLARHTAA